MPMVKPDPRGRNLRRWSLIGALVALPVLIGGATVLPQRTNGPAAITVNGLSISPAATAEVNFTELAKQQALSPALDRPVRVLEFPELEEPAEPPAPNSTMLRPILPTPTRTFAPQVASPPPTQNYQGLDDIPMADSNFIVIPPDV